MVYPGGRRPSHCFSELIPSGNSTSLTGLIHDVFDDRCPFHTEMIGYKYVICQGIVLYTTYKDS